MIAMKSGTGLTLRLVVLSAGLSTRLGEPKALARIRGVPLLRRAIGALSPFRHACKIIVVIPSRAARYRVGLSGGSVAFVVNPLRATGLASSVRLGVKRARLSAGVLLMPADLADLRRRDVARLIARWRGARRRVVARRVDEHPGSPLILPRWLYPAASSIAGDTGLRDLVRRLPRHSVSLIEMPSAQADIDTRADLERARRRMRSFGPDPW